LHFSKKKLSGKSAAFKNQFYRKVSDVKFSNEAELRLLQQSQKFKTMNKAQFYGYKTMSRIKGAHSSSFGSS